MESFGSKNNIREDVINAIANEIMKSDFYPALFTSVEDGFCHLPEIPANYEESLRQLIRKMGIENQIKNEVYHMIQKPNLTSIHIPASHLKEPLDYLKKAQANWERRISKSLNSVCTELGLPLTRKRNSSEQKEIAEKWNELGADDIDTIRIRPVYAPKDFLETLCRLRNPNLVQQEPNSSRLNKRWKIMTVPLKSKGIAELRKQFQDMVSSFSHLAINENTFTDDTSFRNSAEEHVILGKRVLEAHYAPLAREFAKRFCPQSVRGSIWCHILGVTVTDKERLYYDYLKDCIFQTELMVDKLIVKDVKLTSSNDNQYFIFEDYLHQVMLLFSRDRDVLNHFAYSSATPLKVVVKDKTDKEMLEEVYPPNGIIPFHGFTMLISPLCYLFDDPVQLYFVFREWYTRYLFRLHTINSHSQGILRLSLLFENLLETQETQLCYHFQNHAIQPLKIAFKWLMRAFSGYLPMEQVLLLWDTILAYDAMDTLAVLAVAILAFRAPVLHQIRSQDEFEVVLSDLSSIQVIPLVVSYLWYKMKLLS